MTTKVMRSDNRNKENKSLNIHDNDDSYMHDLFMITLLNYKCF